MVKMTGEQARAYIAGEEFDKSEYERQHIIRLTKCIYKALEELKPQYYGNLRKTAAKYVENHKGTAHKAEFAELVKALEAIPTEQKAGA